ncbi:MAG: NPCBM/NEW2 domain-containing protein [Saprospiraceae bacterium]|nr:NPCBM/NEW2 domain-containing protein [Saprospiraceae bacterium]
MIFSEEDAWHFPPGTVFIKHFELPTDEKNPGITTRLETRFIVVKADSTLYGVTYKWNEAGTDAILLTTSDTMTLTVTQANQSTRQQIWDFPSRTDCQTCHNSNAGGTLGLRTWQLNGNFTYPSMTTDNQLNTWLGLGIFSPVFSTSQIPSFLKSASIEDASADLETRVRSYLDANCAHCHRPNGVNGAFDARFSTPLEVQNLIMAFGVSVNSPPGSLIVKPMDHLASKLWVRDNLLGPTAMPPLAKNLVDTAYIQILTEWINSVVDTTCFTFHLADLTPVGIPQNGWGPIEYDQSNGSTSPNDGSTITINGTTYSKGLGVHAPSEITYNLTGQKLLFRTSIGVDDEVDAGPCSTGSVQFLVYLDGQLSYQSPVMGQYDDAINVEIDITGKSQLKLVVTDGGDDPTCDHADWANARLFDVPCAVGPCLDSAQVGANPIYSGNYQAGSILTSSGTIKSNAVVAFGADQHIVLQPNFTVQKGGILIIKNQGCE